MFQNSCVTGTDSQPSLEGKKFLIIPYKTMKGKFTLCKY